MFRFPYHDFQGQVSTHSPHTWYCNIFIAFTTRSTGFHQIKHESSAVIHERAGSSWTNTIGHGCIRELLKAKLPFDIPKRVQRIEASKATSEKSETKKVAITNSPCDATVEEEQ